MKNYLLFRIKRRALDFERLFFWNRFGLLIRMQLPPVTYAKIVEPKVHTYSFINLDLSDKC
jgi:hypothetical protein